MLTRSQCADICGLSPQDIEPIWADRIDEERAAGVLRSFGHALDWGAEALRNRIAAMVRMDIDLGMREHARRNLEALRLFVNDCPELVRSPTRRESVPIA
jgi:hypothetical protein